MKNMKLRAAVALITLGSAMQRAAVAVRSWLDSVVYENSELADKISKAKEELAILTAESRVPRFRRTEEITKLKSDIDKLTFYIRGLEGAALAGPKQAEKAAEKEGIEVLEKKVVEEFKLDAQPDKPAPQKVESEYSPPHMSRDVRPDEWESYGSFID